MRELLFKNLSSQDAHRRILCMSETITQDGLEVTTQRRSAYQLKDRIPIKDLQSSEELGKYKEAKQKEMRHFYVIRRRDEKTGEKLFCKARGCLYVVAGDHLYLVEFTNTLAISFRELVYSSGTQGGK